MNAARPLRTAIAAPATRQGRCAWDTDAGQTAWWLADILEADPAFEFAGFLCRDADRACFAELPGGTPHGRPILPLGETPGGLGLVVETGTALHPEWIDSLRAGGGLFACLALRNEPMAFAEDWCFKGRGGFWQNLARADAAWVLEGDPNAAAYSLATRMPAATLPKMWSPFFVESAAAAGRFGYAPGRPRWRAGVCSPNTGINHNLATPLLALENTNRAEPSLLEAVHISNLRGIRTNAPFLALLQLCSLGKQGLAQLWNDIPFRDLAADRIDCVVSHTADAAAPHFLYEALWGNFPLVHNSPELSGLGYEYTGFDAMGASSALRGAFRRHDSELEARAAANRARLARLHPLAPENSRAWAAAGLGVQRRRDPAG